MKHEIAVFNLVGGGLLIITGLIGSANFNQIGNLTTSSSFILTVGVLMFILGTLLIFTKEKVEVER